MDNRTESRIRAAPVALPSAIAFQCSNAQVCQRRYPHRIPWRRFPFTLLLAIERGAYVVDFRDERCTLGPGQVAIIAPGAEHAIHVPAPGTTSLAWAHVDYSAPSGLDLFAFAEVPRVVSGSAAGRIAEALQALAQAMAGPASGLLQVATVHEIGFRLLRLIMEQGHMRGHPLGGPERFRIEPCLQFIERNLHRPFSRRELADQASLSESRFHDVFRGIMGRAPMEYVQSRRMEMAKRLLINTDRSVSQVASLTGFADPFYFSRLFRKTQGCSPARYRRQIGRGEA